MRIRLIGAALVLSASVAAPAFAQNAYYSGAPYRQAPQTYYRSYGGPEGSYAPRNSDEYWGQENFGFDGRDMSGVRGHSSDMKPSGS